MDLTSTSIDGAPAPGAALDATSGRAPASPPLLETVFPGTSEMAARCRAFDWATTPLGPVERWSTSLRTTVGIVLTSRQPMFLFWGADLVQLHNDAYRPSLGEGGRAERALGARGREFWTDIWDTIGPQIDQVMTTGQATWHEDQYLPIDRNGRREDVWWTYSYSPVRDDDGRIAATLVVCQETTPRVLAEKALVAAHAALAAEKAQLNEIVDRAPAFMAVLRGPEHRFERFNAAYQQLAGGRAAIGLTVAEALPEVVAQGFIDLLDGVLATGTPFIGRATPAMLVQRPGGAPELRYVDFVYQPLTEADGSRSGIFVHGVDVTEAIEGRRVAEQATERMNRLHRVSAALAGGVTLEALAAAAVREVVPAIGAATGTVTRFAADGRDFRLLAAHGVPGDVVERWRRSPSAPSHHAAALAGRVPVFLESVEDAAAHHPDMVESWRTAGVRAGAIMPLVVGGEPFGVLSLHFAEPRTFAPEDREFLGTVASQCALALERARLFEAEHAAREEAERANRAKAEFLASMSHELRTPLNAIGGYAELMAMGIRGPVTDAQREDLRRVEASQRHLLGLINEVLNYAKLETGAVRYDLERVRLQGALAEAETLVAPQTRARGLTFVVAPCPPDLAARADAEKLRQILVNLLSNAIKFTPPGGRVELACAVELDRVHIEVRDTGIGIPVDQQERIFDPFVQVDQRLTRANEGVGLGLAISRDLARGMEGDLTVESAPGEGSTFTLVLPRA